MKTIILAALLLAGCATEIEPGTDTTSDGRVDFRDFRTPRGITAESPQVRPQSKSERIDQGYQAGDLN
jgi:hypothetical protein